MNLLLPSEFMRLLGITAMAFVIVGGIYVVLTRYESIHSSISANIATNQRTYVAMALLLSIGGLCFYLFLAFWLIPHYAIHPLAYGILILSFIAQIGMAWIPARRHNHFLERVHMYCGSTVAICMLLFLIATRLLSSGLGNISTIAIDSYLVVSLCYLLFFGLYKNYRFRYFLLFESIFIGGFALISVLLILSV